VRVADAVAALCVALIGATTIALARQLPYEAEYGPGAGFLPFWLGVVLLVLAVFLLRDARIERAHGGGAEGPGADPPAAFARFAPGAFVPWLVFFVSTVAVSLLFDRLGFALSVALFMLLTMRWVAHMPWPSTVAFALATPVVLYLLFVRILMVPLPLQPAGF
jgi:putative tricarboxylic transport membrane protein